jgi:hypothetical protein
VGRGREERRKGNGEKRKERRIRRREGRDMGGNGQISGYVLRKRQHLDISCRKFQHTIIVICITQP